MMWRASWVGVMMLTGCASATPAPTTQKKALPQDATAYYPLEPGWKWAYDVEQDGEPILATYSVISREGERVTVAGGEQVLEYLVKPDGILRPTGAEGAKGAEYVLRAPLGLNASWPVRGGEARVVGWNETVETTAGRFEGALTVEEVRENPDRRSRTTYAPGVGPVIIQFQAMDVAGLHETKARLRGYTRPGEDPLALQAF